MKICILMGSPRTKGNTVTILNPFIDQLKKHGVKIDYISLYEKKIKPCNGCYICQNIYNEFGCPQDDDMQDIFNRVLTSDGFILATPIHSWYCTPPIKAVLDRLVFGMNKFYGKTKGISLWQGKKCAILATCGYKVEYGADLFEQGMIRYCKHSHLNYLGMLAIRDKIPFKTNEVISRAINYANQIFEKMSNN